MAHPVSRIRWRPCWRLVPSRFPPVSVFDRVANAEDLEIILDIEGLTNDRLREEIGELSLVPEADRVSGPGTTPIMAAFTHLNPEGSRFSDGSYGVYYAGKSIHTAVEETKFHRARFLAATAESPIEVDMRSYASNIDVRLTDIRHKQTQLANIYHPDPLHYSDAQVFGRTERDAGAHGIVYSSVRHPDGECVALFRPRVLKPVTQGEHYCFVWDGTQIIYVYVKSELQ